MQNLVFRRQFVLSNTQVSQGDGWDKLIFKVQNETFHLQSHPDLSLFHAESKNFNLILLGTIIDPFNPENDSSAILQNLASEECFEDVIKATFTFGGRFVIIGIDNSGMRLFSDAMALREVYYIKKDGLLACGSSPSILDKWFNLGLDTDKEFQDFYTSGAFNSQERIMIGDRTMIKGVRHLMPNHYLDMQTMKTKRFWPIMKEPKLSIDSAIDLMSDILTGTYKAVAGKYIIHQGLTSGWDTRLLLAASKNFLNDMQFFFLRGHKGDTAEKPSADYLVTVKIAKELNLNLEIVDFGAEVTDENFKEIYLANNVLARPKLLSAFYHVYVHNYQNTLTISGTGGNEILRTMRVTGQTDENSFRLAKLWKYQSFPYITKTIDEWFHQNKALQETNYRKIDLFFWEQFFGNWGSLSTSEQDIVREELRPFNNRAFIAAYISLPAKYRYADNPLGYVRIIKKLWPELLDYDMDIGHYSFKKVLRKVKLERTFFILYNNLKRLKK